MQDPRSEYIKDDNGERISYNIAGIYRLSRLIYRGRYRDGEWKQYESQPELTMKNLDNKTIEVWLDGVPFGRTSFNEGEGEYELDTNTIKLRRTGDLEKYE